MEANFVVLRRADGMGLIPRIGAVPVVKREVDASLSGALLLPARRLRGREVVSVLAPACINRVEDVGTAAAFVNEAVWEGSDMVWCTELTAANKAVAGWRPHEAAGMQP